jgi:phage terminase large subunit
MEKNVKAKKFQEDFITSKARYPAFVAAWGTGKTYFGLLKVVKQALKFSNNLLLIVRKEFTDLKDSTVRDFEVYFKIKVPTTKDVKFRNGSVIMFRHGDELEVLQNINLGGFLMEQAEEFETDEAFQMLRGRLRRKGVEHFGAVIANTKGHNWIWKAWKRNDPERTKDYALFEAKTYDNESNLPPDFIADLRTMERESPNHYNRYVLNSWEDLDVEDKVIPYPAILAAVNNEMRPLRVKKVVSCDPAEFGQDETVIYGIENGKIIERDIFFKKELYETEQRIMDIAYKMSCKNVVVDPVGVGAGVRSHLAQRALTEKLNIILADGRLKANEDETYFNRRAEMWFTGRQRFIDRTVCIPDDDDQLQEELSKIGYEIQADKKRRIHSKDKIRKADYLGHSPGRAECLIYGLWAEETVEYEDDRKGIDYNSQQETELAGSYAIKSDL